MPSTLQKHIVRKTVLTILVRSDPYQTISQSSQSHPEIEEAYMHAPTPPVSPLAPNQEEENIMILSWGDLGFLGSDMDSTYWYGTGSISADAIPINVQYENVNPTPEPEVESLDQR
ncbi:hypothetical protein L1987_42529 [Smallanthus sonchifolius]|uniref:Uncharacterized protein n=1 Tax=Smallanthus sonchifolius TaxID=185202 RepID=A0ACB9GL28_9ASTR|nr:hypothetical protein L1987_42529 [Smallanthus sonchifolius]